MLGGWLLTWDINVHRSSWGFRWWDSCCRELFMVGVFGSHCSVVTRVAESYSWKGLVEKEGEGSMFELGLSLVESYSWTGCLVHNSSAVNSGRTNPWDISCIS